MRTDGRGGQAWQAAAIALFIAALTVAYHIAPPRLVFWSKLVQYLYFIPILLAAWKFGVRGGLAAALFSIATHLPRLVADRGDYSAEHASEAVELLLFGVVSGWIGVRDREQRTALRRANEEIREKMESLRRADRLAAIGQLAAGLAHEIRNPLASIGGAAEILGNPDTDESTRAEFQALIKKECSRLSRLLQRLLDYAKPRAPEFRRTPVAGLVESVVRLVQHTASQSRVEIRSTVAERAEDLYCDPEQIRQVLLNLMLNGIQAMPGGGVLSVTASAEGSEFVFRVQDGGGGIPPENVPRLYEPFFSTRTEGTGLGLPIVQQIVIQHGGTISVESGTGRGTTFEVRLPVRAVGTPA